MLKAIAPVLVAVGIGERIVGLAGLPDDLAAWQKFLNMIPDEIFGAAIALTAVFAWQRWGSRMNTAVRETLGRAGKLLKIGNTEYIPFDNLVDVVNEIDMKPLGTEGARYGTLPEGTNLVCFPDGRVRLALPVNLAVSFRSGSPKIGVTLAGGSAVPTGTKARDDG